MIWPVGGRIAGQGGDSRSVGRRIGAGWLFRAARRGHAGGLGFFALIRPYRSIQGDKSTSRNAPGSTIASETAPRGTPCYGQIRPNISPFSCQWQHFRDERGEIWVTAPSLISAKNEL